MTFNPLGVYTRSIGFGNGWSNDSFLAEERTAFIFDLRVIDSAVSESGGRAVGTNNLGAISYIYDDMNKNNGKVHLPFG